MNETFSFYDPEERFEELKGRLGSLFTETQLKAHLQHHKAYYRQVQSLKSQLEIDWSLEKIIGNLKGPLYHAAAQYWYHNMFWDSLSGESLRPGPLTLKTLELAYGDLDSFRQCLLSTAMEHFSNGWYGVVFHRHYTASSVEGAEPLSSGAEPQVFERVDLRCKTFSNATVPMSHNQVPILVLDLWEHAYYLDHQKNRRAYLQQLYGHLNWDLIELRLSHWRSDYAGYAGYWAR